MKGVVGVLVLYAISTLLYVLLPAKSVRGYCCDAANKPMLYKLSGFSVLIVSSLLFYVLPTTWKTILYNHHLEAVLTANTIGLSISVLFYLFGGYEPYSRCITVDQLPRIDSIPRIPVSKLQKQNPLLTLYLGRNWNPRILWGQCDVKMLFYCIGAVALWLNILSAALTQAPTLSGCSNAMKVYLFCFFWFIAEYMLGEEGKLLSCSPPL